MKKIVIILIAIIIIVVIAVGGYYIVFVVKPQTQIACTMEAKICPDGSAVGRIGPKCEFASCPAVVDWKNYVNADFGFKLTFPDSWKGFAVDGGKIWHGNNINDPNIKYDGPMIVIINPKTTPTPTPTVQYQDIPIMVFTPDVWAMVSGNNPTVAVSAAPIGPAKIGENVKYVFATPPRWYGFTDAVGWQEAVDIVKTFKAF